MEVAKDVFLTDGRAPYLTLTLASRDLAAHGLLTELPADDLARLHAVLAEAAAAVRALLGSAWQHHQPPPGSADFGCGT